MAKDSVSQIKKIQAGANLLLDDRRVAAEEAGLRPLHKFIHFWVLVGKSFVRNRCPVRASALAYTTLLALIPLLAVGLGVSTTLLNSSKEKTAELISKVVEGLAPQLEQVPGSEQDKLEARKRVVDQIQTFIATINSGALGLTGTVGLVFVAIGLLSTIEATLNDIWGVQRGRNWFVRVIHYWAAITLGPLVIILVMGLAIGSHFHFVQGLIQETPIVGGLVFKLVPFFVLCGSFMMLYQLMPNTKVHWKAALVGGLVAAVLWIANGKFNALFASRVVSASKIYGSLGAIPIFLFGLYLSWTVLLFGAQVAYAYQNRRAYIQEKQAESVNQRGREFLALRVMTLIGEKFHNGEKPPTVTEISDSLSVSSRLIGQTIAPLLQCQLVVEVATPEAAYSPARPLDRISYDDIIQTLRVGKGHEPATRQEPTRELVRGAFDEIQNAEQAVARTLTLQGMVERAEVLIAENASNSSSPDCFAVRQAANQNVART